MAKYGWKRDLPDHRDFKFKSKMKTEKLPQSVDLREKCPPVYDQSNLSSCTANAIAAAHQFDQMRQDVHSNDIFMPSRLMIYYNERDMEGTVASDSGACIRDGIKTIASLGVCPETMWPYDVTKFADKPTPDCFAEGLKHQAITYQSVDQNLFALKSCLAQGNPIVFGFSVYDSFESDEVAKTGIVPMPGKDESNLGGHATTIVGFFDDKKQFLIRNSWGSLWGISGYFFLPYEYVINPDLADDFWTIQTIEVDQPEPAPIQKKNFWTSIIDWLTAF